MDWFYAKSNQQLGPVPFQVLSTMFQRGELQPTDLVWRDGMPAWVAASSVPELAAVAAVPSSIGYYNPVAAANAAMGEQVEYAGFWLRFIAWIIDLIVLVIVNVVLLTILAIIAQLNGHRILSHRRPFGFNGFLSPENTVEWIVGWIYYALLESSVLQATLGKMALGLVVTDLNGQRLTFGRASGRYWGRFVSDFTICIGFMMAGWTQRKQALHDIMASCLVIRKR